jgi:tRNA-Thr(GGU) m(6)t(6)A37 methyltransferase TsaA
MKIEYRPIGVVRSPFTTTQGMPIQPTRARDVRGTVELDPAFAEGVEDLEGFSHIILLSHLHRSKPFRLKVVPFLDTVERGLFATRSPNRPNPIGLSVVRLVKVDGPRLEIEGIDLLDGTPVLDIKPFVGDFEQPTEISTGWLEAARRREKE